MVNEQLCVRNVAHMTKFNAKETGVATLRTSNFSLATLTISVKVQNEHETVLLIHKPTASTLLSYTRLYKTFHITYNSTEILPIIMSPPHFQTAQNSIKIKKFITDDYLMKRTVVLLLHI